MAANDSMQQALEDIELKLHSAREAAGKEAATAKDKADLKLIELEYLAAQQKERRQSNLARPRRPTASGWQEGVGQEARRGA